MRLPIRFPMPFPLRFPIRFPIRFPVRFPIRFHIRFPIRFPNLESNWHHSRTLAVCNAILSTGMGPILKNVALVREWCAFLKHQKAPLRPTAPGGQGRQGGKGTLNFDDFWG